MKTIDADAHVIENERTWDYMEKTEHEFKPQMVKSTNSGEPKDCWLIDGRLVPRTNVGKDTLQASRELGDIEARLKHMDELGIDMQILYPTVFIFPGARRAEVELALCRSYNRWMASICKKAPDRFRWIMVPPLLSMDKALGELRLAKESGACGIFMRGLEGDKYLSDSYFFPLYEEAGKLAMPVCIHSGNGSFTHYDFFDHDSGFTQFKLAVVGAFHSLIFHGIPDRFPKLRFGIIEVSSQWLPYVIHDLAKRFQRRGEALKQNLLQEHRIYVACQTDDDLPYVLTYAGEDNIVIGSDYGHADTSTELEAIRKLQQQGKLGENVLRKILDDNPRRLYSL